MVTRKLTRAEKATLTKPHYRKLWGTKYKVEPALVEKVFGDGKKLLLLSPIMTRPDYYIVQIDSKWDLDGYEFLDHLDEIYDAIEEQYGCEHNEGLEDEDFPVFHHGGSTWGEMDFPRTKAARRQKIAASVFAVLRSEWRRNLPDYLLIVRAPHGDLTRERIKRWHQMKWKSRRWWHRLMKLETQ